LTDYDIFLLLKKQKILKFNCIFVEVNIKNPEEVKLMRYYLPAGMYVILVKENHNIVKTYKFTTINAY
jgi:hypothetical protein